MTRDDVLVVSHDRRLNPDLTRSADGQFLSAEGPAIRSLTLAEVQRYDVGRLKPGSTYAANFPEQKAADGARIPALTELFDLVKSSGAAHVRFNIETKITPTCGAETPDPDIFAAAVARAIREAGLTDRAAVQSFDWRTLIAMKRIAPEIERVCLTAEALNFDTIKRGEPGPSPWTAGLDIDDFAGSVPRLVAGRGLRGVVAALPQRQAGRCRRREGARPQGHPLDRERARRHGAAHRARRRRHHHRLSGPPARRDGGEGDAAAAAVKVR